MRTAELDFKQRVRCLEKGSGADGPRSHKVLSKAEEFSESRTRAHVQASCKLSRIAKCYDIVERKSAKTQLEARGRKRKQQSKTGQMHR